MTTIENNPRSGTSRENIRSPYVCLVLDVNTYSEFPSDLNYCHRSQPLALPVFAHQREYCLSSRYSECPMLSSTAYKKLPADLRITSLPTSKPRLPRWILPVFILVIFLLGSLATLIIPELSSAFGSFLGANPTTPHAYSQTPALTRLGFITPSPYSLFSIVKSFTPRAETAYTLTATPTPAAPGTLAPTPTPMAFCSAEDLNYFSVSFFINDVIQLVFDTDIDFSVYQVLDAQGKPTLRLNLPDFKLWRNDVRVYSFGTFMRNPALPTRLYVELLAVNKDKIIVAFTDGTGTHCSKTITIPDENLFKTPTSRMPGPTQYIPSPTVALPTLPPTLEPTTEEPPTATPIPPTPSRTPRPSETMPRDTLTPTPNP
ncbi:MAG: hypothetical protein AAGU04_07405 [Anaerolineaceae bacterium]